MKKDIKEKIALILRPSVMEAAFALDDASFRQLITKMYYFSRGEENEETSSEEKENPFVKIIFEMEKPFLQYNLNRFIKLNNIVNKEI